MATLLCSAFSSAQRPNPSTYIFYNVWVWFKTRRPYKHSRRRSKKFVKNTYVKRFMSNQSRWKYALISKYIPKNTFDLLEKWLKCVQTVETKLWRFREWVGSWNCRLIQWMMSHFVGYGRVNLIIITSKRDLCTLYDARIKVFTKPEPIEFW